MHIAVLPSVFLLNFLDTLLLHVPVGDGPVSDGPVAIHSSSLLTRWPLNLCFLAGWCRSFNIYSIEILISLFQILVWLKVVHTEPGICLLARGMQGGSSIKPCPLVSFRVDLRWNLLPTLVEQFTTYVSLTLLNNFQNSGVSVTPCTVQYKARLSYEKEEDN